MLLTLGNTAGNQSREVFGIFNNPDAFNDGAFAVDRSLSTVQDTEQQMCDLSERMLIAVAARYGKDSYEYEMAGGTRKRERKRPQRRTPAPSAV